VILQTTAKEIMELKKLILGVFIFPPDSALVYCLYALNPDIILSNSGTVRDSGGYKYVSPLLMCGISEQVESSDFEELKSSVEEALTPLSQNGDIVSFISASSIPANGFP
jgi:hypothetical protein